MNMGEGSLPSLDRAIEQAIVALKKGAHLCKYGKRGKSNFYPFRLSMDERFLLWYSGPVEKKLRLSKVTNIIHGHNTKLLQLEKESQCLSLIYGNGKSSLQLICKDEVQAECWFIGLRAVISRNHCTGRVASLKKQRGAQSCINSPAAFMRRKQILGLSEKKKTRSSEASSLCGSPPSSLSARCTCDGMSCSSDSFYSASSLSNSRTMVNVLAPSPPLVPQDDINNSASTSDRPHSSRPKMHILKDVYIWGEGAAKGYLGGGEAHSNALLPKLLESATMLDVRSISLGKSHAAIVTEDGQVFCWGEARRGRLGHRVDMDTLRPKIVDSFAGGSVARVSCGTYQTCASTLCGEVYTWGDNYAHDLLDEDSKRSHWLPHRLSGSLKDVTVSNVSCGEWHTAIVSVCGRLFTHGDGTFGALGHGDVRSYSHPKQVESIKGLRVKTVACGPWHTAAVIDITVGCVESNYSTSTCGKLFTWGDSDKGRLGHPDQERKLLPTCVAELLDHDFVQVSCGDTLTVGLTTIGRVFTIGSAAYGQLGVPQARDKSIAAVKGRLIDEFIMEISSGSFHVAVLTSKGNVYTWGKGENGQLGLGDTKDRNSPSLVDTLKGRQVEKVTCGMSCTAAICAHKSSSMADCRGCGNAFGFTRKRYNCYNCGRLICRACSSKRSVHEKKLFRVCNDCFNEVHSVSCRVLLSKLETRHSPMKGTEGGMEGLLSIHTQRRKSVVKSPHGCMDKALPRWGHVSCPQIFTSNYRDAVLKTGRTHGFGHEELSPVFLQDSILGEKYLSQEILKLKAQVDSLQKLCETREEKIQENKTKTEQVRSLTKEETTNFKEADELIQILTSKLCQVSEKISLRQEAEDRGGFRSPQKGTPPVLAVARKAMQLEDSSSLNSPRSLYGGLATTGTKCPKVEWVEQYQAGVFITFTALQDGRTGLRRIRFRFVSILDHI